MVLLVGGTALLCMLVGMELVKARRRLDAAFLPMSIRSSRGTALLGVLVGMDLETARRRQAAALQGAFGTAIFMATALGDRSVSVIRCAQREPTWSDSRRTASLLILRRSNGWTKPGSPLRGALLSPCAKASAGLPPYCLALMQNVPSDEQVSLTKSLALLDEAKIDEAIKVRIFGLQLMNVVGPSVLTAAVASLRDEMKSG